jgi:hypothetical protein
MEKFKEIRELERLTYMGDDTVFTVDYHVPCLSCDDYKQCESCAFGKIIDRLGLYENYVPELLTELDILQEDIKDLQISCGKAWEDCGRLNIENIKLQERIKNYESGI